MAQRKRGIPPGPGMHIFDSVSEAELEHRSFTPLDLVGQGPR